jgi:nudix-type nucleoside diphosphatase (YffH/AdpP family)
MKNKLGVRNVKTEMLSQAFYTYKRVSFDLEISPGQWESQKREVLERGNGATILLYDKKRSTVILTRQFRMPTHLNGNESGLLIEAPAGSVENESPESNIIREVEEEVGLRISNPKQIFSSYMSPGAVSEIIYFFTAPYDQNMKVSEGGGNAEEHEHIEVMEVKFEEAIRMMNSGDIKDAKTIMLLQYALIHRLLE